MATDALTGLQWLARFASMYGVLVSVVCVIAILTGSAPSRKWGRRLGPPWVQRLVAGIALAGLGATAARAAIPAPRSPVPMNVVEPEPSTFRPEPPPTTQRSIWVRPAPTTPPVESVATEQQPIAPTVSAVPRPTSREWTVRPGDHFWRIARQTLATAWGRTPTDREIDPYWRSLIALNRHQLVDPRDPDLLYVGQVIDLPPIPVPASRAA